MTAEGTKMKIGFIHNRWPGAAGAGSTIEANVLTRKLCERGHDITVFCHNTPPAEQIDDGFDIVDLAIPTNSRLANIRGRQQFSTAINNLEHDFSQYDIVHSYVGSAIPGLAKATKDVDVPVAASLIGYGSLCPKKDLLYMNKRSCSENGMMRCTNCSVQTLFSRRSGYYDGTPVEQHSTLMWPLVWGYYLLNRLFNLSHVMDVKTQRSGIDRYHTTTSHMKKTYTAFGFPSQKIDVVPGMLDERFLIDHRSDFEEPFSLLYVGALRRKKGVAKLVPILDRLLDSGTDFSLTVVGDGPMRQTLAEQVRENHLQRCVKSLGHLPFDEMPEVYADHDIFVYPGILDEPFGRVFIEALATGTPIVGSQVGAFERIVGDGGAVTDGSIAEFVETILEIIDEGILEKMSKKGKDRADRYKPGPVIDQFEQFYQRTLSNDNLG